VNEIQEDRRAGMGVVAMTGRDESLIMCDRCGLGYPGREIANLGSLERPEWLCADCFRDWVDSIQFGDGFGTATQPPLPRLKNAPSEVLMPGFPPDDYPLDQPSGSDAHVRSWRDIERTDHPTMPSIGDDEGWPPAGPAIRQRETSCPGG